MTPKEKADELCSKMLYQIEWNAQPSLTKEIAKQCALIAVDEIIDSHEWQYLKEGIDYWQEVKQEIDKFKTK